MEHVALVQELAGVDESTALAALSAAKGCPVSAVDALLAKPVTPGDAYIPKKPTIDDGLSDEQRERCERGRWLQEKVNVVFSVAHSQIRTQQDEQVPEASVAQPPATALPQSPAVSES